MRELDVREICHCVEGLLRHAVCHVEDGVILALKEGLDRERSPFAKEVLSQLLENNRLAAERDRPICQDTGLAIVFLDIGQEVCLIGGDLTAAVDAGVRQAYGEGYLRKSAVTPLLRENTGDNTPAILHARIVPGDRVRIRVAPKGFGSENMSRLAMLSPERGMEGVLSTVVESVSLAGPNPCPPVVVGVGIGGSAESCAILAKEQLLRPLGQPHPDGRMAALEREALHRINALGIGPMGLGGDTTALAVHMAEMPTHIASLPVFVNMQCHAYRHGEETI